MVEEVFPTTTTFVLAAMAFFLLPWPSRVVAGAPIAAIHRRIATKLSWPSGIPYRNWLDISVAFIESLAEVYLFDAFTLPKRKSLLFSCLKNRSAQFAVDGPAILTTRVFNLFYTDRK